MARGGRYRGVQITIIRWQVLRIQSLCRGIATVVRIFQSLHCPLLLIIFILINSSLSWYSMPSHLDLPHPSDHLHSKLPPHLTSLPRGVLSMRQQGSAPSSEAHSTAPHCPRLKQPSSPQLIVKRGFLRRLCTTLGILVT